MNHVQQFDEPAQHLARLPSVLGVVFWQQLSSPGVMLLETWCLGIMASLSTTPESYRETRRNNLVKNNLQITMSVLFTKGVIIGAAFVSLL